MTTLEKFIDRHPNKNWCWESLSKNSSITLKYIENNINKPWSWFEMSFNENITRNFVEKYINKNWYFEWLDVNGVLGESTTLVNFNSWNGEKECICRNEQEHLSRCININFLDVITANFGLWGVSSNINVTLSFIKKNINRNWFWGLHGLSSNPNLTQEFVEKEIDRNWEWGALGLSSNLKMDIPFIEKYKSKLHFGSAGMSSNKYITMEIIEFFKSKDWSFYSLSNNPNITPKFIEIRDKEDWNWLMISSCTFNNKIQRDIIQNNAASIIQRGCFNWLWKPICKDMSICINARLGIKHCNIDSHSYNDCSIQLK